MPRITNVFLLLLCTIVSLLSACALPVAAPTTTTAATTTTTRIVPHALGESTITGTPQRIVALEWTYVEDLLALGLQPIGVADIEGYHDWVKVPIALDPTVVDVGERGEPNLETLAGLKPDLIITAAFRSTENYEQLSAIAPTIAFDSYPTDESITQYDEMRQTFLTIADLVGRTAEGEAVLAQMAAKFAAARSQLEADGKLGESFVLAQAFGGDTVQIRLFTDNAMATQIVTQLGLENGWDGPFDQYGFTTVSIETLPELGDVNFFYVVQDDNNVFTREAIAPLWNELTFVQNDNAYPLGGDTWLFGGPLSAELVVDKVMAALAPATATTTSDTTTEATRTMTHALGVSEVPTNPQRVVVLDALDNVLALGMTPVGAANWIGTATGEQAAFPTYLDPAMLVDIEWLGDNKSPNLERLVALQPDLILGRTTWHEEIYAQLSAIAPTVIIDQDAVGGWRGQFLAYADALNRTAAAETLLAAYDARAAAIAQRLAALDPVPTVSLVRFDPDRIVIYEKQIFAGSVLADAGVLRPAYQAKEERSEQISPEQIELLDGDVLLTVAANPAESILPQLQANPLWDQLTAVQQKRVYPVAFDIWVGGWTITGANLILDDVERYVLAP